MKGAEAQTFRTGNNPTFCGADLYSVAGVEMGDDTDLTHDRSTGAPAGAELDDPHAVSLWLVLFSAIFNAPSRAAPRTYVPSKRPTECPRVAVTNHQPSHSSVQDLRCVGKSLSGLRAHEPTRSNSEEFFARSERIY